MALLQLLCDALRRFVGFDEGIDVTGYVSAIEQHFSVRLAPAELESTHTLGDMTDLIARKAREGGRDVAADDVWPELRRITAHEFGVDASELNTGIRYVEDLNC